MEFMLSPKQPSKLRGFPGLLIFIIIFLLAFLCFAAGRYIESLAAPSFFSILLFILSGGVALTTIVLYLSELANHLSHCSGKLDQSLETQARHQTQLLQISQGVRISDKAKEIVFRDAEQIEMGEAVLYKLHQHDFDSAEAMIQAMEVQPRYSELAARLKKMSDKYRTATEEGRISQIIQYINGLLDQHLWSQAAAQIKNLIIMFPHSEKANMMTARLQERKNRYKRKLLLDWDKAVQSKQTDRSLEILKELDLYLSAADALALRESAASVFKTKLHNLGVEFQMAVSEKNWTQVLRAAKQIAQNFPNSRMAAEIRSKMDILQERARQADHLQ